MTKDEFIKEFKSTIALIVAVFVIILILKLFSNQIILKTLVYYIVFTIIILVLNKFIKFDLLKKITNLSTYPIRIALSFFLVTTPFVLLIANAIIYFAFAFGVPEITYMTLTHFHLIEDINSATITYSIITSGVLISVLFNPILMDIVNNISPFSSKHSNKMKAYEPDKLTNYILSVDIIRFLVYGSYVIVLLYINLQNFQKSSASETLETDRAIIQSFVTFIAIDRAISLMKMVKFKPSTLMYNIIQSINKKVESLEKNDK